VFAVQSGAIFLISYSTLKTALFRAVTHRVVVNSYRRLGKTLSGPRIFNPLRWDRWVVPETSVRNHHHSMRNSPEERNPRLLRGRSLKWRSSSALWPYQCRTFPTHSPKQYQHLKTSGGLRSIIYCNGFAIFAIIPSFCYAPGYYFYFFHTKVLKHTNTTRQSITQHYIYTGLFKITVGV